MNFGDDVRSVRVGSGVEMMLRGRVRAEQFRTPRVPYRATLEVAHQTLCRDAMDVVVGFPSVRRDECAGAAIATACPIPSMASVSYARAEASTWPSRRQTRDLGCLPSAVLSVDAIDEHLEAIEDTTLFRTATDRGRRLQTRLGDCRHGKELEARPIRCRHRVNPHVCYIGDRPARPAGQVRRCHG